jgi:hypothetical protein
LLIQTALKTSRAILLHTLIGFKGYDTNPLEKESLFRAILLLKNLWLHERRTPNMSETEQVHLDLQEANAQLKKQVTEQAAELLKTKILLKQEIVERQKVQKALITQNELICNLIDFYPNTILTQGSFAIVTDANNSFAKKK